MDAPQVGGFQSRRLAQPLHGTADTHQAKYLQMDMPRFQFVGEHAPGQAPVVSWVTARLGKCIL